MLIFVNNPFYFISIPYFKRIYHFPLIYIANFYFNIKSNFLHKHIILQNSLSYYNNSNLTKAYANRIINR